MRTRLEQTADRDDARLLVASIAGEPVGMAVLCLTAGQHWWERPSVLVTVMHVRHGQRHRGIGKALLAAALAWADETGTGEVAVDVPAHLRDANRFFARMGFAPVVSRRSSSVAALRRRLGSEPRLARVVDLRVRQRSMRRRDAAGATGS